MNKYELSARCQALVGPEDTVETKTRHLLWPHGVYNQVEGMIRS